MILAIGAARSVTEKLQSCVRPRISVTVYLTASVSGAVYQPLVCVLCQAVIGPQRSTLEAVSNAANVTFTPHSPGFAVNVSEPPQKIIVSKTDTVNEQDASVDPSVAVSVTGYTPGA